MVTNRNHPKLKYLLSFFIAMLYFLPVYSQESIDLFTIEGRYGFPQPYEEPFTGKASEYASMINMKVPVVLSEANIWYNDLTYNYYYVNTDQEMPDNMANPIRLHGFILQTGWVHRINETTALQFIFTPRYMTDFVNATGSNLQFGGMFLFEKIFNENLMMRFGALYNHELGGPFMVPLVYLNWRLSPRWSINGLLPIFGKIKYEVNEQFSTGLAFFGLITSFSLGDPAYAGDYIERTSIDPSLFARYKLVGKLHIEGRFGYAIDREYAQYDADQKVPFRISIISFGDNRVPKNVDFGGGIFASVRLVYNLPLK